VHYRSSRRNPSDPAPYDPRPVVRLILAGGWVIFTVLVPLSMPTRALAQFKGTAAASGRYEYNSNVFDADAGLANPGGAGSRSDGYYSYGADFAANYKVSRQELYATAQITNVRYQRLTQLDHTDYTLDTGLRWALGEFLDGRLGVNRTHTQVPFANLSGQVLALTVGTQQTERADIGLKLPDNWRIEGAGSTSKNETPIPQDPNLALTQNVGRASLQYVGIGGLATGFTAEYTTGRYSGANSALNSSYDQTTVGAMAKYKLHRTTMDAQLGYTNRTSATGLNNASGLTALLDFQEQVTPRTSVTFRLERTINSYLPTLGSEIDSVAGFTVDWEASYRLHLLLGYTFTYRDYPPQPGYAPGANRVDYQQEGSLSISYQARSWLVVKPYANILTRESNVRSGDFRSNIVGVTLIATVLDNTR
jgi:hypothetical protein